MYVASYFLDSLSSGGEFLLINGLDLCHMTLGIISCRVINGTSRDVNMLRDIIGEILVTETKLNGLKTFL